MALRLARLSPAPPIETPKQLIALFLEEQRIGRHPAEHWPEPKRPMTTDEYLAFLRRIPTGTGLAGYLRRLAIDDAEYLG